MGGKDGGLCHQDAIALNCDRHRGYQAIRYRNVQGGGMAIYRVFSDADGESHIEDLKLEEHPELGELINVSEVRVQEFDGSRHRDFNPLPERRLIIHLSGEVEIGASDGAKRVLRAGDIRLMEDVTGKGHSHNDLTPSAAVYVLLND